MKSEYHAYVIVQNVTLYKHAFPFRSFPENLAEPKILNFDSDCKSLSVYQLFDNQLHNTIESARRAHHGSQAKPN